MGKLDLITWSPTYSVWVPFIDDQHKELFRLINDLYNHCVGDPESERLYFQKVIKDAVNYIKVHFSTEEKLMLQTKFSGYAEHKKGHNVFIYNVLEQVKLYEETQKISLLSFTNFLREWILTHIAICDKQYFEYFKKIATRKSDGTFSISMEDIRQAENK